jgi:hypothetical protein
VIGQRGRKRHRMLADFLLAPFKSLAGTGTQSPILVVWQEPGLMPMKGHLRGRSSVPPRCAFQAQPVWHKGSVKRICNLGENGCHSGLDQKLVKSAVSETKESESKEGCHELLGSSLGVRGG